MDCKTNLVYFMREKERLEKALSQEILVNVSKEIMEVLTKYNLDMMPILAADVMIFTVEEANIERHIRKPYHSCS